MVTIVTKAIIAKKAMVIMPRLVLSLLSNSPTVPLTTTAPSSNLLLVQITNGSTYMVTPVASLLYPGSGGHTRKPFDRFFIWITAPLITIPKILKPRFSTYWFTLIEGPKRRGR